MLAFRATDPEIVISLRTFPMYSSSADRRIFLWIRLCNHIYIHTYTPLATTCVCKRSNSANHSEEEHMRTLTHPARHRPPAHHCRNTDSRMHACAARSRPPPTTCQTTSRHQHFIIDVPAPWKHYSACPGIVPHVLLTLADRDDQPIPAVHVSAFPSAAPPMAAASPSARGAPVGVRALLAATSLRWTMMHAVEAQTGSTTPGKRLLGRPVPEASMPAFMRMN